MNFFKKPKVTPEPIMTDEELIRIGKETIERQRKDMIRSLLGYGFFYRLSNRKPAIH